MTQQELLAELEQELVIFQLVEAGLEKQLKEIDEQIRRLQEAQSANG